MCDPAERERQLLEYGHCLEGYHARDTLVQDQFYKVVQIVALLAGFLAAVHTFGAPAITTTWFWVALVSMLGLAGFWAVLAIIVDMAANSSCKRALLKHCADLESDSGMPKYASVIAGRGRYRIEEVGKNFAPWLEWSLFWLLERVPRSEKLKHKKPFATRLKC